MDYTEIGPIKIYATDRYLRGGPLARPETHWVIRLAHPIDGKIPYVVIPMSQMVRVSRPIWVFENALNTLAYMVEFGIEGIHPA